MIIILLYALLMQSEVDVNLKKLACVSKVLSASLLQGVFVV